MSIVRRPAATESDQALAALDQAEQLLRDEYGSSCSSALSLKHGSVFRPDLARLGGFDETANDGHSVVKSARSCRVSAKLASHSWWRG